MNYRVFYIIENLLRLKCLKWVRMTHLDIWNTSYSQKKGQESNWQFDSRSLKVMNHPDFLTCRWRATYRWKALDEGYNFASNLISIGGLHAKLWGHKVARVSVVRISRLPPGSPGTICHLDVGLGQYAIWKRHKVYYKGEGGGFPQVRVVVSLVNLSCPWLVLTPDALPSPGVNPLEGSPKCSCEKLGLGRCSRLPTLKRGRGSSWEPRD